MMAKKDLNMNTTEGQRQYANRRHKAIWDERNTFNAHYKQLSNFILPRRGRFLVTDVNKGTKKNNNIVDSTATRALRILSSGMQAGITSPARPWFRLEAADPALNELEPVKQWLFQVTNEMRRVLNKSNFYNTMQVLYEELACFGTTFMIIEPDFEDVIYTYPLTVGEYALITDKKNRVMGFTREFSMTLEQIAEKYGYENMSKKLKGLYDEGKQLNKYFEICHLVEPNNTRVYKAPWAKNKPFRSWTWEKGESETFLRQSGYDKFPGIGIRWHVTGGDVYGTGCPGMDALPDVKQLQVMVRRKGQGVDKLVNPPMIAHPSLKGKPATVMPGGVTYLDAASMGTNNVGFQPAYQLNLPINEIRQDITEVQRQIYEIFFADLFQMISQMEGIQPRGELELIERKEEKLIQLGPVLERFHYEGLNPIIDLIFDYMDQQELIPEAPEQLQNTPLKIEYISLLAQAQKAIGVQTINQTAGFVGNLANMDPEALDKFDTDQAIDEFAEMVGTPPKIIRSDEAVAARRADRQKQQQEVQRLAQADALAQSAKTLSETNTEAGNVLGDVVQTVGAS